MEKTLRQKLREGLLTESQDSVDRVVKLLNSLEFKDDVLRAGGEIYAVGGIVRDALMGKPSDDLDIVVRGIPYEQLFRILSRYGTPTDTSTNKEDKDFGATKFKSSSDEFNQMLDDNGMVRDIDVMLPRKDAKDPNVKGHKGIKSDVNHNYTIEDDMERRDLTINSIALGLDGRIIDKNGQGQKDIKNGVIRAVSEDAFLEDPLRMLRAVRFQSRFDYQMDPATLNLIKKNVKLLSDKKELPAERFLMEFEKMIGKADLGKAVKQLVDLGMYEAIFGVKPKISDFSKFAKAKNLAEFAFMMFEGQPLNMIPQLVRNNITNNKDVGKYIDELIKYLSNVKGKSLGKGERLFELSKLYKKSPAMLLVSTYVDEADRDVANQFASGELPKDEDSTALKGGEFKDFMDEIIINKFGSTSQGPDGKRMGKAKRLTLQAIYAEQIPNEVNAIKQFLLNNQESWLN
jgi:hypothetical protein